MAESEAYQKNTKEAYEALGRFVEAFEQLVSEVREINIELIARDRKHGRLLEIVFHHGAMTAKPLFEIMRALIAERVSASIKAQKDDSDPEASLRLKGSDEKDVPLSDQDQTTILGVLSFISGRYMDLATKRNNLLHATWYIGYSSVDDPDSSTFLVSKFTPNGEGLRKLELPSKASELKDLAEICRTIEGWILWLQSCLTGSVKVAKTFQYDKETKIWWLVTPQGFRTTLPKI